MKLRTGFLLTCAAAALVTGLGPRARAADQTLPLALPPPPPQDIPWWFQGYVEVGGRVFLNNPQRGGISAPGQQSLAKYYEYSTIKPGPFLDGHVSAGSRDGLYEIDLFAKNVGYSDQSYLAEMSKAGQQYLNLNWDQTPHVYSTSAQTLYNGIGTSALTLPPGLSNKLFLASGCTAVPLSQPNGCGSPLTPAQAAAVQSVVNSNLHQTDIGIRRDTANVEYRATPTDDWDVRFNYQNMHRSGTQVEGVVFSPGTSGVKVDATAPVSDTTQNYGASVEHAGTSLWGQNFNLRVAYSGSTYTDDASSYTVENPFCPTGAIGTGYCARNGSPSSPLALMSQWPSNQANAISGTVGADLPWKSRYMGTLSYTAMRQNQPFQPFTLTPLIFTNGNTAPGAPPALPGSSLNGAINTLLVNNVVTTQITPDLKNKASYRYYNFDNGTPEILFNDWVLTDVKLATQQSAPYGPVRSISVSYIKQDAGEELTWHPTRQLNLGAGYGWERYSWTRADADVTDEHSGKAFGDWRLSEFAMLRASGLFSERRFQNYDYLNFVGNIQWLNGDNSTRYSTAYRQFYLDNRDRSKGQLQLELQVLPEVTVTPSVGAQFDDYKLNPTDVGLVSSRSQRIGAEVAFVPTPKATILFSYMYERYDQHILATTADGTAALTPANTYDVPVQDDVNTFMLATNLVVIPDTLDLKFSYTVALSVDRQPLTFLNGTLPATGQYPEVNDRWYRFDASAKYKFDPDLVRRLGWQGNVYATLRYSWERNVVNNWQNDLVQPYLYSLINTSGNMTWLASDNPNYNVHLLAASMAFQW